MSRGKLVEKLETTRKWAITIFLIGYVLLLLHLAGILIELPHIIWQWYGEKLQQFPRRSTFALLEVVTGLFVMNLLRQQIPKRGQVTSAGGTYVGHFLIQTIFWFAIILEFPIAILFTIYGATIQTQLIALCILATFVFVVFSVQWLRPKFRSEKFRGFFAPLAAMVTPGISILNRAHMSRMLPDGIDKGIEWILLAFQRVIVGPASHFLHMLF